MQMSVVELSTAKELFVIRLLGHRYDNCRTNRRNWIHPTPASNCCCARLDHRNGLSPDPSCINLLRDVYAHGQLSAEKQIRQRPTGLTSYTFSAVTIQHFDAGRHFTGKANAPPFGYVVKKSHRTICGCSVPASCWSCTIISLASVWMYSSII